MIFAFSGFIYCNGLARKQDAILHDSRPEIKDILTTEGEVTWIFNNCKAESIYPNKDTLKYSATDCGTGANIRVNEKYIRTASDGPGFYVDISSLKLGDKVSVKYVNDKKYGPSLNCNNCLISSSNINSMAVTPDGLTPEKSKNLYTFKRLELFFAVIVGITGFSLLLICLNKIITNKQN